MSCNERTQSHVHEFVGSVRLAEIGEEDVHNHRFAGVTGEVIQRCDGHRHRIETKTDFFNNHFHEIDVITGPPIPVGCGRHVHFVYAVTKCRDGHRHSFIVATLIENPIENK
ncbi:YmaF family protein [Clostridium carnis]